MDSRPSPAKTSSVSLALVSMIQVLTVAASPLMASATRVMSLEYSVDLAAAFWLTIAATPEGAQGQVTFQVALLLPQPASIAARSTKARLRLSTLFFILIAPFCVLSGAARAVSAAPVMASL